MRKRSICMPLPPLPLALPFCKSNINSYPTRLNGSGQSLPHPYHKSQMIVLHCFPTLSISILLFFLHFFLLILFDKSFFLFMHYAFFGQRPRRGRSPVEHRGNLSVRPYVRPPPSPILRASSPLGP